MYRPQLQADIDIAEMIAGVFFDKVVLCLTEAHCVVETFIFNQAITYAENGPGTPVPYWESMDLSRLRHLTFGPNIPSVADFEDDGKEIASRLSSQIRAMFSRSARTLETFVCKPYHSTSWYHDAIPLPYLRELTIGGCKMSSEYLCGWLRLLPSLEFISLIGMTMYIQGQDGPYGQLEPVQNWKLVLDALRGHENLRKGEIEFCLDHTANTLYTSFIKDDVLEQHVEHDEGECEAILANDVSTLEWLVGEYCSLSIDTWAMVYICGKVSWGGLLEKRFG